MPKLNIPEKYRSGIAKIRKLDLRTVREIRAALDQAPMGRAAGSAARESLKDISAINASDFKEIAAALAELYSVKSARDISDEEFAESLSDATEALESPEHRLPSTERAEFKDKVITLLGAEAFSISTKVHDLATEDERTFCEARIITDLRPVFGKNIEDGPRAMVVVHLLKLGYHFAAGKEHKDFYVSLDADDLKMLRKLVDRAEAKANTLRASVKVAPVLGIATKE